jgi:hypothetical protein
MKRPWPIIALWLLLPLALPAVQEAHAQCFGNDTEPAQMTAPKEKDFPFQPVMRLCDRAGKLNIGIITDAYVALKHDGGTTFELTYNFYNGTWGGFQPIILTVQDGDHRELLQQPFYYGETERAGCRYDVPLHVRHVGQLEADVFDQAAFVTFVVPPLSLTDNPC